MKALKPILFLILCLFSYQSFSFPCSKYKTEFGRFQIAVKGDLTFVWTIDESRYGCGFKKDEINGKSFEITVTNDKRETLFETVATSNTFRLPSEAYGNEVNLNVSIIESNSDDNGQMIQVEIIKRPIMQLTKNMDSINFYLANGFIANTLSALKKNPKLIDELIKTYQRLMPLNHSDPIFFYDVYYDKKQDALLPIAKVNKTRKFIKVLNSYVEGDENEDLTLLELQVSNENSLEEIEFVSNDTKTKFEAAIRFLRFNGYPDRSSKVYLLLICVNGKYRLINDKILNRNKPNMLEHSGNSMVKVMSPVQKE